MLINIFAASQKMRHFLFLFIFYFLNGARPLAAQSISYPVTICAWKKKIAAIEIEGNRKTQSELILREMSIQVGDSLGSDSVENILKLNYQRLYNLNLSKEIQLSALISEKEPAAIIVKVILKEQWFLLPQADVQLADRNINVWWNEHNADFHRMNLGLYLQHKNLTGRLDQLKLSTHLGYTQQFTASYFRPYVDASKRQGLGISAGFSRSKEIAYSTVNNKLLFTRHDNDFLYQNAFAQVSWYYRAAYHSRHIVSLGFQHYQVGDTVLQLRTDFFEQASTKLSYAELAYRFEYNGVDNWNYPRKGTKLIATSAARYGFAGVHQQVLVGAELGHFKRWGNRWLGSAILRAQTNVFRNSAYFLQTAMGYRSNYVRGYEYYVVEANRFAIGRLSIKYEAVRRGIAHLPFKYLPKLPLWIYPKIFVDAGYASNNLAAASNTLANTLLYSVGFGCDVITAYDLKLRIEFAYNHLGENGLYLHANSE